MNEQRLKTKVYVDGANVFYTQKKLGWSFDWAKIKSYIEEQREVIEWRYYVAVKDGFDVEMAIDILSDKARVDGVTLISGDSDFQYLVRKLKDVGKKVSIFSSKKTISWELKLEASHITYFEKIREIIERK